MTRPDDIAADLPAPRDDEPESLRRDIVDELADHLGCAYQRELHRTRDEEQSKQVALARFGNPKHVARRLYWDAMKEKIMNQRITIAVLVVLVLISAGMFLISWQSLGANREMVRESHELNRELIAELRNLAAAGTAKPSAPAQPAEWNRLQVRCVLDTEDGPPAEGIRVSMKSASENTTGIPPSEETSDAEGMIDLGQVLYGQYTLELETPDGMSMTEAVSVHPGEDRLVTVVSPHENALVDVQMKLTSRWDAEAPDSPRFRIWYGCLFRGSAVDDFWTVEPNSETEWVRVLISPEGRLIKVSPEAATFLDAPVETEPAADAELSSRAVLGRLAHARWTLPEDATAQQALQLPPMKYTMYSMSAFVEDESAGAAPTLLELRLWGNGPRSRFIPGLASEVSSALAVNGPQFRAELSEPQVWEVPVDFDTWRTSRAITRLGNGLVATEVWTRADFNQIYSAAEFDIFCIPAPNPPVVRRAEVLGRIYAEGKWMIFVALRPEERRLVEQMTPEYQIESLGMIPAGETPEETERTTTLVPLLRELLKSGGIPENAPDASDAAGETTRS